MGNVDGRTAIRLANTVFGHGIKSAFLNLAFEIFDGELVVETLEGDDAAVDPADFERLRFMLGAVVFGDEFGAIARQLGGYEEMGEGVTERVAALIEGLESEDREDVEIAIVVNNHPVLLTAVAFTVEQGKDGSVAYRLYRNPDLPRAQAAGFLKKLRDQFAEKAAEAVKSMNN